MAGGANLWQEGTWWHQGHSSHSWQEDPWRHESRSRGRTTPQWENWSGLDDDSSVEQLETTAVEPTAAVAEGLPLPHDWPWYLEYFQSYTEFTNHYRQHNIALKYLRDRAEARGECLVVLPCTQFVHTDIAQLDQPGEHYRFSDTLKWPWYWQEMVAQLDGPSMQFVVHGEGPGRSRGIVGCMLEKSDRYDHKRSHANPGRRDGQGMLKTWDFILERADGTKVALHPSYKGTKIELVNVLGPDYSDHEIPRSGLGGTSGPGTFKHFKWKHMARTLNFDASKQPQAGPQSRHLAGPQSRPCQMPTGTDAVAVAGLSSSSSRRRVSFAVAAQDED
jgi:hypothetical protein